jgi:hypothetical protein
MALIELVQGERGASRNVQTDARAGAYSELIVNDIGLGRYFEAARVGRFFSAFGAGVTVGTAGAVTNPVLALYVPAGSRAIAIEYVTWTVKATGTFAAYDVLYYYNTGQAAGSGAANVTPVNEQLGGPASVVKAYAAVTNALANAPTVLRPMSQNYLVTYAGQNVAVQEEIAGRIIVPPQGVFAVNASASQTAGTADVAVEYVEIDWPLQ